MPDDTTRSSMSLVENRPVLSILARQRPQTLMSTGQAHVLIVDDDEAIRRALHLRLAREGYFCGEAANAQQATVHINRQLPNLIILDVRMPGKSGRELLPEIVAAHPEIAVIMATAAGEADGIVGCMKNGAQDYILKPFSLEEVVRSVDKALRAKRLELQLREYKRYLEQKVDHQAKEIRKLFLGAVESLVFALEAKDKYTAGHSRRVAEFAVAVGRDMGLSPEELEDLRWGARLHDIGKIAIDPSVQNKPGRLTPEEYGHIMTHPQLSAQVIQPVVNPRIVEMARHHHDRYDGKGLQQALVGENIPLGARIIAVADTFDAMTSDRPYRVANSKREALAEIARCAGTQFDPVVAAALLRAFASPDNVTDAPLTIHSLNG